MKFSRCSLGILREIDETFNVHTSPYGGIREDYDDSNFVYLVPCICNEIRAQQFPLCVDRRIREKKKEARSFHFRTILLLEKTTTLRMLQRGSCDYFR